MLIVWIVCCLAIAVILIAPFRISSRESREEEMRK